MSNTVWPFTIRRPYSERATHNTTRLGLNNGREVRRVEFGSYGQFIAEGGIRVPMNSQTIATWHAFVTTMQGGYDSFLYKPHLDVFKKVTLEAVGTGDGTTTAFTLDSKHIDSSTLLVYKATVLQTGGGTDYTFSGNNTAPTVTFNSAPTLGQAIEATYERYYPVVFVDDDLVPRDLSLTGVDSTSIWEVARITLRETSPGAHRA